MKKIFIIWLSLLSFIGYGQAEFEKIAITENTATASTTKIVSQQPTGGELNYIDAADLPVSNAVIDSLELKSNYSSTSIRTGCVLTNNGTTFNVSAGTFVIADNSTGSTVLMPKIFAGVSNVAPIYPRTILYITSTGTLVQFNGATGDLSPTQRRQNLLIGGFAFDGVNILAPSNTPNIDYDISQRFNDLTQTLGVRNQEGNVLTANGANLAVNKTSGRTFRHMGNYDFDKNSPDVTIDNAAIPIPAGINLLAYRNGVGGWTYEAYSGSLTPTFWDNGTGVKATVANNKFTIPRVYFFNGTDTFIIYLGQKEYGSIDSAIGDADRSDRVIDPATSLSSYRGGIAVEKDVTDLTAGIIANTVRFIPPPGNAGAAGGGTVGTQNIQSVYNNSVNPEITTDATRGAFTVRNGQVSDTSKTFEGQNIAGSTTFSVTGAGVLSASNKQNSLAPDGTGVEFPTVDAVNAGLIELSELSNFKEAVTLTDDGFYNAFPSLEKALNGDLVTVYRKGVTHLTFDGSIRLKRSTDNGDTWGSESTIITGVGHDYRDPSITRLVNGNIIMSYFDRITDSNVLIYTSISTDNGVTFGTPVQLTGYADYGKVSSKVIQLVNGDLLLATYGKSGANGLLNVFKSINNGTSWSILSTISTDAFGSALKYTEPYLILAANGDIIATIRNDSNLMVARAISTDSGATWSSVVDKFAGNSRASMFYSNNVLYTNYRGTDGNAYMRFSSDSGVTFSDVIKLSSNELGEQNEYSGVTLLKGNTFAYVYSTQNSTATSAYIKLRYFNDPISMGDIPYFQTEGFNSTGSSSIAGSLYNNNILGLSGGDLTISTNTSNTASNIILKAGNTDRVTILGTGFVGFGKTVPTQVVDVVGNGAFTGFVSVPLINTQQVRSNSSSGILKLVGGATNYGGSIDVIGTGFGANAGGINFRSGLVAGESPIVASFNSSGTFNVVGNITASNYTGGATLTGTPTAPTAALGTNTTQIATMAAVQEAASSSTYTVTYGALTNITSPSSLQVYHSLIGKLVTVHIRSQLTITTASVAASMTVSLPFTASGTNTIGSGVSYLISNEFSPLVVRPDSSTTARIDFFPLNTGVRNAVFSFSYLIP